MWKFKSIKAKNLMSFALLEYTFLQGFTTLVFGENRDNESQKSNGSGKSALIEGITISITGSPMRKVKNEEIINDAAEECEVVSFLENDGLCEIMEITRHFFRKGSSTCEVRLFRNGELVVSDEAKQSSVDEYNKYILSKLGLTKDEVYNNFILSKHKYQDFLSSSDKEKKEIINRFSNGNMVDEAIEKVKEDKLPIENQSNQLSLQIANISGKIEVLTDQIATEKENISNQKNNLNSSIQAIQDKIADKRKEIRELKDSFSVNDEEYSSLLILESDLKAIEVRDLPITELYQTIKPLFTRHADLKITDWPARVKEVEDHILSLHKSQEEVESSIEKCQKEKNEAEKLLTSAQQAYKDFSKEFPDKKKEADQKIASIKKELESIDSQIKVFEKDKRVINSSMSALNAKLSGTIVCPKCSHEFVLADENFDVNKAKKEVVNYKSDIQLIEGKIKLSEESIEQIEADQELATKDRKFLLESETKAAKLISDAAERFNPINAQLSSTQSKLEGFKNSLRSEQNKIDNMRSQMFDEIYDLVDALFNGNERQSSKINESLADCLGRISALENNIEELKNDSGKDLIKSLTDSLSKHKRDLSDRNIEKQKVDVQLKDLETQAQRFVEFKTYLANTKIEALSTITNEFLESIGSDIRIKFTGFKILKSGKIKDQISISILRDGLDCGSFGKFSEGEKARVNLASILAMQKLVNSNCDLDGGLDLIVLDEILESVDEDGLANMFKALNKLRITALVVSHGLVSESYPYKLIITKENGESTITNA